MDDSTPGDNLQTVAGISVPTMRDVLLAAKTIRPHLAETPVLHPALLDEMIGAEVYVKCENIQPIGAFKVRGGVNLVATEIEGPQGRGRAMVAASTGNHGQSIAYAARLFGVEAHIFMPVGSNPLKASRISSLGARLVETGRDFDEAREEAEKFASEQGYRYVHPAAEPLLVAGVATATVELLRQVPDLDVLFVPVGAGSGACGASIVARALAPGLRVIAVQSENAPAAHESWRRGEPVTTPAASTVAEGLATRVAYEYPVTILKRNLWDFLLVSDADLEAAVKTMFEATRQVAEEAGAAALAAALAMRKEVRGKRVGLMLSGGNITTHRLLKILGE